MANEQNLIKNEDLTPSQRRENASKAGKASGRKRAERKKFEELFNSFLDKKIANTKLKEQMKQFGFTDKECTNKNAMVLAQYKQALKGNTKAFVAVRDTMGEKPKDTLEVMGEVNNPFAGMSTEELRKIINDN